MREHLLTSLGHVLVLVASIVLIFLTLISPELWTNNWFKGSVGVCVAAIAAYWYAYYAYFKRAKTGNQQSFISVLGDIAGFGAFTTLIVYLLIQFNVVILTNLSSMSPLLVAMSLFMDALFVVATLLLIVKATLSRR